MNSTNCNGCNKVDGNCLEASIIALQYIMVTTYMITREVINSQCITDALAARLHAKWNVIIA